MTTHKPEWEERAREAFKNEGGHFPLEYVLTIFAQEIQRAKEEERERVKKLINAERMKNTEKQPSGYVFKNETVEGLCRHLLKSLSPDSKTSDV